MVVMTGVRERYDVVVVGGGPAGLGGALTLARARRSVLVVDAGEPRNAPAEGAHGVLGLEGIKPTELLRRGRAEVRGYGGEVVAGEVLDVTRDRGGFAVACADGTTVRARAVLVASGLVDGLPEVPGLREHWGGDVVHCPYCHGWEVRERAIGVLGTGPMSLHQVKLFRQWTDDLVYFPDRQPVPEDEWIAARGIRVVPGEVAGVESDAEGRLSGVRMADRTFVPRQALAVATRMEARAGFLTGLGLAPVPHPSGMGTHLPAEPTGRTEVPGLWIAGNATDLSAQVGASAAAGVLAAAQLNMELVEADTERALTAHRAREVFSPESEARVGAVVRRSEG
ncbi:MULTISPECIES: NAD(P)/FAD-dependent oxidoreductase [unclassified Streptomyces]|uniref:NAD(P)/FAD-dependent oxidoreductase n=1 Tax=unclassified Streptomyces TaxID=2593676 RepID=UPI003454CF0A